MKRLGLIFVILIAIAGYWFFGVQQKVEKSSFLSGQQPSQGGVMIIGVSEDVDTFNPLYGESVSAQEITHLLLLGLADLNEKAEFEPELAERWEHSTDFLKLTYFLRRGIHWSDGEPVSAYDVKFTFDLLKDTLVASPRAGVTEFIKNVFVVDSFTVTFEFTEAYPAQIFDTAGEILPEHLLKNVDRKELRMNNFSYSPVSSGPFKLQRWEKQQFIELVPNEQFFGDRPFLDRVVFKIVPDQTSLLMQLESGEVDMMYSVPPVDATRLKEKNPQLEFHHISGRLFYFIGYNQKNSLFKSVKVRRALTLAIDCQTMIDALLYGYGSKCFGPLPPIVPWAYTEQVNELLFNPDQSRQILQQEGWIDSDHDGLLEKEGKKFEFDLIVSTGNQLMSDVAVVVQNQLKKIGVQVNIGMLEWNSFIDRLQSHNFDASLGGLSSSYYIDPTPVFHSSATELFNAVSYANPEVDRLIEAGRSEMNQQKASLIWKEFQQKVYDDQPYTFLFWLDKAAGVNKQFRNVTPLALSSLYNLEKWYKVKEINEN